MPLLETVVCAIGPAISKTVLKLWIGDNKIVSDASSSAVDALAKLIPDLRARNEAIRQLDSIGERAAESLMFTFHSEGRLLFADDQETVALLVARTLESAHIDSGLLIEKDLDPVKLAQYFVETASEELSKLSTQRVQLFTRVIEEAAQSIIDVAHVLPNFSERTISALLKQNRVLVDAAHQILSDLERIRATSDDDAQIEATRFETEYRRAVLRNLNRVELFGIDVSRTSRSYPLSVAYVSLEVSGYKKEPQGHVEVDVADPEDVDESKIDAVELALAESNRFVIRGPAGAGKTTLMHWIAVQAASRGFQSPLQDWNTIVPFIVRLRQFSDTDLPTPEQFPALVAPSISETMPRGWVIRLLRSGSAVIMIDGVDEVQESRRTGVRQWLTDMVSTFPNCRFIVTSRPHAIEQDWLTAEGFIEGDLQPMDLNAIDSFIDHWHLAVREEVERDEEIASLDRLAQNLKSTLRSNVAIRRLATNPLLCSVICALHRDTNEQLPQDRLDLYERCCSMLLERRDPESGLKVQGYPRLSYRQKRLLLEDLAYWMIKNEWSEIARDVASDRLQKKTETFRFDQQDRIALSGETSLRFFLERSGILREPLKGKVDFAHRTFQEFLGANAAISEGDIGVLLSNATNSLWREVVILGAALARPAERSGLIKSLIRKGDADRSTRPQYYLLAVACLETAVDIDNALRNDVQRKIEQLFPPKSLTEAMQIAEAAGDLAVPFLKRKKYLSSRQSAACVRALALIGTREAAQAIAEYAEKQARPVLREVARSASSIDSDEFLNTIAPHLNVAALPGNAVEILFNAYGPKYIPDLAKATELSLSGRAAQSIEMVSHMTQLHSLKLSGAAITNISPLSSLKELEVLELDRTRVNDLAPLNSLSNLKRLFLDRCKANGKQVAEIKSLELISLSNVALSDLGSLASMPALQRIIIYGGEVDLSSLSRLKNLESLVVSGFGADIADILKDMPGLKSVSLIHGDVGNLQWLGNMPNLQALDLFQVRASDFAKMPQVPSLKAISVRYTDLPEGFADSVRRTYPKATIFIG